MCRACQYGLPSVAFRGDHRCAFDHRNGVVRDTAAYARIEWMRSSAGACGPDARLYAPIQPDTADPGYESAPRKPYA